MKNKFFLAIKFVGSAFFASAIASCASNNQQGDPSDVDGARCVWVLPLYKDELKQASEVGIVKMTLGAGILKIDDAMVKWNYEWIHAGCGLIQRYPNRTNGYEYHLTPGVHVLELMYETVASRTKSPTTLIVNIEAGKIYEITAKENKGRVNFAINGASPELKARVTEEFQSFLDSRAKKI